MVTIESMLELVGALPKELDKEKIEEGVGKEER